VSDILRIATRRSALALRQSEMVAEQLRSRHPGLSVELVPMTTKGDRMLDTPLARIGGKGLFVKELEQAMLSGDADIAVHSMKDVPAELPEGLCIPVVLAREDPRDAFIGREVNRLRALGDGARVGTSSLRRRSQLAALRPDLDIVDLRGNVDTRLRKLDDGEFDAIILACAGLNRLGLSELISEPLPVETMLPAIGQGAVGIEARSADETILQIIGALDDPDTHSRVIAERSLGRRLGASCTVPLAGLAQRQNGGLTLSALLGTPDGKRILRAEGTGEDPASLGGRVAEALFSQGAKEILEALRDGTLT
jgi:hydroxymethylbilane synthase